MEKTICQLCGEPMPKGEEMFQYHGYSGPCPKPPLEVTAAPKKTMGDDHVMVPKAALAWLFGEAPDANGKWFGECEDEVLPSKTWIRRTYWWRSKFRSMVPALNQQQGKT